MEPNVVELAERLEGTSVLSYLTSPETLALFETTAGPFEAGRYPSNWGEWVSNFSKKTGLEYSPVIFTVSPNQIFLYRLIIWRLSRRLSEPTLNPRIGKLHFICGSILSIND